MADAIEGVYSATPPTLADGQQVELQVDSAGNVRVVQAAAGVLPAGAATAANQLTALNGATSTKRILSAAASVNATSVKAAPGTVRQITGRNARASSVYLKFYDKAAAPTVGTDTPRKTIEIPASSAFVFDCRDYYAVGIAFGMTTAAADADTGALTAGDIVCLNVDYL